MVAPAVILAKDLMRLAHLNRSKCTHTSADTIMCSAYRGKARVGGARVSFTWAMTRRGVTGLDIGGIIYECWLRWSKEAEAPLDYLCLDNSNGAVVHVTQFNDILKRVAMQVMPDPAQASWITSYSFRRFPCTLCAAVGTGVEDQVIYGGWAGMPTRKGIPRSEQASVKSSMPRRYSDRRVEHEEFQKLLHIRMVQLLADHISLESGDATPVSWECLEQAYHTVDGDFTVGSRIRTRVKEEVAARRAATSMEAVWGTTTSVRREFAVSMRKRQRTSLEPPSTAVSLEVEAIEVQPVIPLMIQQLTEGKNAWFSTTRMKQAHRKLQEPGVQIFSPACNGSRTINSSEISWVGEATEAKSAGLELCPICEKRATSKSE